MFPIETAFKVITDRNGKPLENGYVYFGQPNLNPLTSPQTVYWDAAGTQPAAQPLRTVGGYIMRSGTPANVFISGPYSELVLDSKKRQVFYARTSDDFSVIAIVVNFILSLAGATGAALIGFLAAGANAFLRTLLDKSRERVSVEDYYNPAMGTNWTLAWQRAIAALPNGGIIEYNTPGSCDITDVLVTTDAAPIIIKGKGSSTIIRKAFNGDMINLGKKSELRDIKLDGNGAAFTGRGVIITTGAVDLSSWRRIDKVEMVAMAGFPIEFTNAISGYGSVISNTYLGAVAGGTAGVKMPASELNGNRQMINVFSSGPMFDAAGCNNHYAQGCEGAAPTLSASSVKVRMNSCRIPFSPSTPTFIVDGVDTLVADCEIGTTGITFNSTLSYCNWFGNDDTGAAPVVIDNANGTNRIQIPSKQFVPGWTATAGVPAIGNGSFGGTVIRRGESAKITVTLNIGTTTVTAGTTWQMTMPYIAARNQAGPVFINDSGNFYAGTVFMIGNTNICQFVASGNLAAIGAAVPFAWANGDYMVFDLDYTIK